MTRSAVRFSPALLDAVRRAADGNQPIADIWRLVGAEAERRGVPRPSYERVRVLVHEYRRLRPKHTTAQVMLEVAFRARPPEAMLDHVSGVGVPPLRP